MKYLESIKYPIDVVLSIIFVIFVFTATSEVSRAMWVILVYVLMATRELKIHIDNSKEQDNVS